MLQDRPKRTKRQRPVLREQTGRKKVAQGKNPDYHPLYLQGTIRLDPCQEVYLFLR